MHSARSTVDACGKAPSTPTVKIRGASVCVQYLWHNKQVINLLFRSMYQKPEKPRQRCALLPRLLTTIVAHLTASSKNHAVFCGPNHRARRKNKQKEATLKAFKTRSQSSEPDWERPESF